MKLSEIIEKSFSRYFEVWTSDPTQFKENFYRIIRNQPCLFCKEYRKDKGCKDCPIYKLDPEICVSIYEEFLDYPDETMFKIAKILDRIEEKYKLGPHNFRKMFLKIKNK